MTASRRPFRISVFVTVTLVAALVLLTIVLVPQWLSKQARLDVLRTHVAQIARLAASTVDGDLHRELMNPANFTQEKYDRLLAPLVRFHQAIPEAFYVYTMMERDGQTYFVLDTANAPVIAQHSDRKGSKYMEHFRSDEVDPQRWLARVARGETWVYPDFQRDDFGDFLTGHTPILDRQGRYSGFVGVDVRHDVLAVVRVVATIALIVVGGRYLLRPLFRGAARAGSPEVYTAVTLLVVIGTAWLGSLSGISMSLGAFLAGVLLPDSEYRHEIEAQIQPFRGLLLGLFFIGIGMSLDLGRVFAQPELVGALAGFGGGSRGGCRRNQARHQTL